MKISCSGEYQLIDLSLVKNMDHDDNVEFNTDDSKNWSSSSSFQPDESGIHGAHSEVSSMRPYLLHCDSDNEETKATDPESKKRKRILANRRSARESYQRRKKMLSELEQSVMMLTKDNANLTEENKKLRQQVQDLHEQLGLSRLPSMTAPHDTGFRGLNSSSLSIQHLTGQPQVVPSAMAGMDSSSVHLSTASLPEHGPSPFSSLSLPQDSGGPQQQGELERLLELILRGRTL
jgi:hypothetical protein